MGEQTVHDLKVLYAEDDAITRADLSRILAERAREIIPVANGAEGLEAFRRERPDLIVTDLVMPVLDGLGMLQAIRQEDAAVPVIVTTAHSDASAMLEAIDLGADQYVLKPVHPERFALAFDKCAEVVLRRRAADRYALEREQLITTLEKALANVKVLSGLLPICASCKKIRDGAGYWQQIEEYVRSRTDAEFSHSICPDCAKKLYPEFSE